MANIDQQVALKLPKAIYNRLDSEANQQSQTQAKIIRQALLFYFSALDGKNEEVAQMLSLTPQKEDPQGIKEPPKQFIKGGSKYLNLVPALKRVELEVEVIKDQLLKEFQARKSIGSKDIEGLKQKRRRQEKPAEKDAVPKRRSA